MTRQRTALITPNWRWDETPLPTDTLCPPASPPLEMAYVAAGLSGEVTLIDAYVDDISVDEFAAAVEAARPQQIVISTAASMLYWRCPPMTVDAVATAVSACRAVSGVEVILIGPHGSFSPQWTLLRTGADGCWRGAPERRLADWLSTRSAVDHLDRGAADAALCVESAATLPVADMRWLHHHATYPPHMWCVTTDERERAADCRVGALAESSRGCPWACVYCAKAPLRDAFTRRPAAHVAAELDELVAAGVDYVFFVDETFNLGGRRFYEVIDLLAERPIAFGFQGRPERIDESVARRLADAGCLYVELGVDINDEAQSAAAGRRQSPDQAMHGIDACRSAIPIVRYNRLNMSTFDYRVRLRLGDLGGWTFPPDPAYPYPGAPLGRMLMQLYGHEDFSWDFALRYSWWLRMEVELQRSGAAPEDSELERMQRDFLALDDAAARDIATELARTKDDTDFRVANKYVAEARL